MTVATRLNLAAVSAHHPATNVSPLRAAAVLVPVIEGDRGTELLFIRRSADLEEHPGQIGFPGGGAERVDGDRRATAFREAREEVGLQVNEIAPIGHLDDVETVSGYSVTPVVAGVPDRAYSPTDAEVAGTLRVDLAALTAPENHAYEPREHPDYGSVPCHHFHVEDQPIWGATARMVVQLLVLGTDWTVPEPPGTPLGELIGD